MEDTESHGMTILMAWQCDVTKLHDVSLSLVSRVLLGLGFRKISLIFCYISESAHDIKESKFAANSLWQTTVY